MEFRAFATKLIAPACLIRHLMRPIVILSALLSVSALAVDINQHGLTGSWYDPSAAGQGVEIEVYQDAIAPGVGYLQGSWATFAVGWEIGQRWYTFGGAVQTGQSGGTFTLFENVGGGKFNAPPATKSTPIGTVVLSFLDCSTASMKYQDVLWDRYWGPSSRTMPLVRVTPNVTCSDDGASRPNIDFSYSGHWFDPAIPGQGLFIELNPIAEVLFVVWYTYSTDGAWTDAQEEVQRWYTGLGKLVPGPRTFGVTLYETTGGVIGGSADPAFTVKTQTVGTATATFFGCATAQLNFNFTAGSNAGASGTVNLSRVGPAPPGCGS
jgi:pseudomonalisin